MSRADLLLKLTVGKDKRTVPPVEREGSIRYLFRRWGENMKKVLLYNIVYIAIFALPLIFSMFILPTLVDNYVYAGKSFIGNFGIGFPNVADSLFDSIRYHHKVNRMLVYPCILLSSFIAFFGLSGLFHCARGMMWEEKVKLKSFFRGIKKLWKQFLTMALVFTGILACDLYGFGWHAELMATNSATAGSYALCVILGLVTVFFISILTILLPSFACYDFKFFDHVKNSVLLFATMTVPTIIVAGFASMAFLLTLASFLLTYLVLAILLAGGFLFIAMMCTTYGQNLFDNFIATQVDKEGNRIEVKVTTRSTKELARQYVGKKGKDGKKQKANVNASSNPNKNSKKKNQKKNTYNSSYKRKK